MASASKKSRHIPLQTLLLCICSIGLHLSFPALGDPGIQVVEPSGVPMGQFTFGLLDLQTGRVWFGVNPPGSTERGLHWRLVAHATGVPDPRDLRDFGGRFVGFGFKLQQGVSGKEVIVSPMSLKAYGNVMVMNGSDPITFDLLNNKLRRPNDVYSGIVPERQGRQIIRILHNLFGPVRRVDSTVEGVVDSEYFPFNKDKYDRGGGCPRRGAEVALHATSWLNSAVNNANNNDIWNCGKRGATQKDLAEFARLMSGNNGGPLGRLTPPNLVPLIKGSAAVAAGYGLNTLTGGMASSMMEYVGAMGGISNAARAIPYATASAAQYVLPLAGIGLGTASVIHNAPKVISGNVASDIYEGVRAGGVRGVARELWRDFWEEMWP